VAVIFLLTSWVYSENVYAGHPDQDPAVAELRQLFKDGKIPAIGDIPVNRDIGCYSHWAVKDEWKVVYNKNFFHYYGVRGFLYNKGLADYFPYPYVGTFNAEGMQGMIKEEVGDTPYVITTRLVTGENSLIAELALRTKNKRVVKSEVLKDYRASHYMYCPLD